MHEQLPLAKIQETILEFLQGRKEAILFGAQAVNAYVGEPRMTQDVNLLSMRAKELAEELRGHLSENFISQLELEKLKIKVFGFIKRARKEIVI